VPALQSADFDRGRVRLDLPGAGSAPPVVLTYLGVGGWLIETAHTRVLTAPLFSNPSLWAAGLGTIEADTAAIADGLRRFGAPDVSDVTAILSGHAHYDHLMDVPWLATRLAPRARVLANTTALRTLAPLAARWGLDPSRLVDVSADAANVDGGGRWIALGPDLRVLPLVSDHAPHFVGMTLYDGDRSRDLPEPPRAADEWLEGETLAFVFEVLDTQGRPICRIYYQDAVASEPFGFIPSQMDTVDVALIVPATYSEVAWQPEAILENTRARHVILGHWENFFEPPSADPDPVPFTLLPDFIARLRRALDGDDRRWSLPVPGTRFEIGWDRAP
jgi:L-ascorbate metabolism protein UlaG (beta-lactamase superfamily)